MQNININSGHILKPLDSASLLRRMWAPPNISGWWTSTSELSTKQIRSGFIWFNSVLIEIQFKLLVVIKMFIVIVVLLPLHWCNSCWHFGQIPQKSTVSTVMQRIERATKRATRRILRGAGNDSQGDSLPPLVMIPELVTKKENFLCLGQRYNCPKNLILPAQRNLWEFLDFFMLRKWTYFAINTRQYS